MKIRKGKLTGILAILFISLLIYSCYDKDLVNISETVFYTPEYSFPIGKKDILLDEIITELGDLTEIPDTVNLPDTVPIFIYDDIVFESPTNLTHTSIESYDFSTISTNLEHVTSLMLRTNSVNEVPGELNIKISFLDENYYAIPNLCKDCILTIDAASINEDGELVTPGITTGHDTFFNENEIDFFANIRYIQIDANLNIEHLVGKKISYYPNQKFSVQLGLKVKFDIPLHEI